MLLTKTIDAKKAKTGDQVVAKVTQDMKTTTGEVLVPKDTKVMGHITEAQARNKEQKESEVAIAFDRTVTKDGSQMQMPMSIQAIIGPQNNGPQNSNASGGSADMGASSPASPNPNGAADPAWVGPALLRRHRVPVAECQAMRRTEAAPVLPSRPIRKAWSESPI